MSIKRMINGAFGLLSTVGTRNEHSRKQWLQTTLAAIPAGSRILDAGAGELSQKRFCSHLDYVSQDFGVYDGQGDGAGLQTGAWDQSQLDIVSDITEIPEPDNSFDAIMCIEVLEHLPDPTGALGEFSRLLKPGGSLILTAPFCSLTHFAPYHFHSGFNRYFYTKHLPALGFDVEELTPNGNYYEYLAQETRRAIDTPPGSHARSAGLLDKIGAHLLLRYLANQSREDVDSHETLCFGYHVLAKKR